MAPFPWVKMLALMTSSVSQVTANYGLTSYVGYMVAFLQIGGDDKDNAGEHNLVLRRVEAAFDTLVFIAPQVLRTDETQKLGCAVNSSSVKKRNISSLRRYLE